MAMISDSSYVLHAIRLSALRTADDSVTPRIVTMDGGFASNPYINAMGLGDIDRWPELKRALDSPPPDPSPHALDSDDGLPDLSRRGGGTGGGGGATGLRYTQTIMPAGRTGGAGMRVSGRDNTSIRGRRRHISQRSQSSSVDVRPPPPVPPETGRPRASSTTSEPNRLFSPEDDAKPFLGTIGYHPDGSSAGMASAIPSDMAMTVSQGDADVDEGEEDDEAGAQVPPVLGRPGHARHPSTNKLEAGRPSTIHEEDRRSSTDTFPEIKLEFGRIDVPPTIPGSAPHTSALTATLNQHVPHLVSTGGVPPDGDVPMGITNPFASLYANVVAPQGKPSLKLELFFPHSDQPSNPILATVRKDATVEEVIGHALWKYVGEGRTPELADDEAEQSTVGWGLRIVEDDGEVDEDFPPLDRESAISKFSYGQFGIVRATPSQKKQNAAIAPTIQRRPSRIIADVRPRRPRQAMPIVMSPEEDVPLKQAGLSSSSGAVLLHVFVRASADVQFNTTIWAPSDMYIADLTEVLVTRKSLLQPATEWVLCLADLSLALPLDRTVASLEGMNQLTLVREQWAAEHGLKGDMRGGDPSASIFKRASEPPAKRELGQTYKKYTVVRKTPIGRAERQLAIDNDYIHILPSENRAFFDSLKTTSIHITLVASIKLSGRAGGFKLYVWRDGSRKRYEFEAENVKQAQEIVDSIEALMRTYQRERNSMFAPLGQAGVRGKVAK
ncbi:hypothetical protein CcaverHIS002_0204120 [Cutaneotrichosporon cavernicola]|uniref:SIN1-domain-containing protein n=1 Tax=Cutaneotrichosporon cavernicola TaxID=279322 RepID=A0AA48L2J0_9TREE|nr:uncharacterized protein CcaverHIS019_0204100 [Cutaneotrichosporon cavernicola]BEI81252.1 hypothetical protein CcaverHIS002_0204120 [Cutaneotrichosporon cavernicola]BEI89048.1 hypothetical protein CcaverHIS019_0204100 [Cutaneotrichosporon cavernicola]BEI96823.1 hypothetical protein CcaverHIS631_0204120 [Cutaneotrichosporon cavernicola]BEJ04595.1 hypothetical protein CcaverHIS641_0204120 [Cutaneotrichosporon cavernicola]